MEIVDRIYKGYENGLPGKVSKALKLTAEQTASLEKLLQAEQLQIPIDVMGLQDCVDLAITLLGTTIKMQQLAVLLRGVGGPIDVVTITRTNGVQAIQFKEVSGDST